MWQSQAFAGALSFGDSVPEDHGTCCAKAWSERTAPAAAASAIAPAVFISRRRSMLRCMEVLPLLNPDSPNEQDSADSNIARFHSAVNMEGTLCLQPPIRISAVLLGLH